MPRSCSNAAASWFVAERLTLGDFRVTLARAGFYLWDGGALFGVVPKTLWGSRCVPDQLNRIRLGFNCYVIETGDHTVLLETGGGDKMESRAWERMGLAGPMPPLPEMLAVQGIDPEAIDIVVNSHLHWDHAGGNTIVAVDRVLPAFPHAAYYARRGEWEHAHERHPRDSISYIDANYDPLIETGRMRLLDQDAEIVPGVRLELAPGHTRDMMVVKAVSNGATFCFFSDLVPTAAHLKPTWVAAFDLYPLTTITTKQRLLAQAAAENWVCGFAHDPEIAFARIPLDPETGKR
jgi:glyoxylase-like metal-dependent hydrolase (beta-lactamase superfamily II)